MSRVVSHVALIVFLAQLVWAQDAPDPEALWDDTTLYRDAWGTPHVYAESFRAMGFGAGYAQAEDHLEAVLMAYRAVNGRSAEVLGEDRLPQDTYAVRMRFSELARQAYQKAHPDIRDLCEGFALGVNTWLLEHPGEAPDWAEGVEPKDVLALMHAFLIAHVPFDVPELDVRDKGLLSANAWAVAPKYSASGNAMLAASVHAEFDGIYRWCEMHLSALGYEVTGATICGLPVLLAGTNENLAWTLAPNAADVADIYDEESVEHLEETLEHKTIYVLVDDELQPRRIRSWRSPRGPIVALNMGRPLAWKVGGYGQFGALEQFLDMGFAKTFDEFEQALEGLNVPAMNVVYADRDGNIFFGYLAVASERDNPVLAPRGGQAQTVWERPVTPNDATFLWKEPIFYRDLPTVLNPDSGYVAASGGPPWLTDSGDAYPAQNALGVLVRDRDTPSAQRARELFDRGPKSARDLQAMLFDRKVNGVKVYIDTLVRARERLPRKVRMGHPDLPAIIDMLTEWNGLAEIDSMGMTFYHVWSRLIDTRFGQVQGLSSTTLESALADPSDAALAFFIDTASEAARLMVDAYQSPFVPWGEVHALSRGDKQVSLAGGNSGSPIFWSTNGDYANGVWSADAGYAFAFMVEFADQVNVYSALPFGASDRHESPHHADQMTLLRDRRLKVAHLHQSDIFANASLASGTRLEFVAPNKRVRVRVSADERIEGSLLTSERFDRGAQADLVPFSVFVEPAVSPLRRDLSVDMIFSIPESYCAREDLSELGVYGYHPETGWQYVFDQGADLDLRALTARDYAAQVYVVLGPKSVRHASPAERPQLGSRESAISILAADADSERVTPRTGGGDSDLFNTEEGVAQEVRPEPRVFGTDAENPFGASANVLAYEPERGARDDDANEPLRTERPDLVPQHSAERVEQSTESTTAPPTVADNSNQGTSIARGEGYELKETAGGTLVVSGSSRSGRSRGDTNRLRFSDESPTTTRAQRRGASRYQENLAPDASKASPTLIGTSLQLELPGGDALFHIDTPRTVRAQAFVTDAPAPFPEGTTNFTPVYGVRRESESVPCTVGAVMRVNPAIVAEGRQAELALYVFDVNTGWMPLTSPGESEGLSFQALDLDARYYVVLGPATARLTQP